MQDLDIFIHCVTECPTYSSLQLYKAFLDADGKLLGKIRVFGHVHSGGVKRLFHTVLL